MKIIYIVGKSSVGKDTIYQILKKKLNIKTYVMYTTRPIRTGEKNGVDYYYLQQEEMEKYIKETDSKVIEYRTYNTVYGPWTYATIIDKQFDSDENMLMEGTLESYNAVRQYFVNNEKVNLIPIYIEVDDGVRLESYNAVKKYFENNEKVNVIPIYIEVDDGIRLERALKREREQENPKYEELCRRFLADSKDFSEEKIKESGITKRFQNNNIDECVQEIIDYIK